jgi:CpeT/CpcT family (DUF1001)
MAASRYACLLTVLLVAACAPQPKRDEVMVNELTVMLAGSYDNIAQSRAGSEHPALRLMVVPVQAPLVADHVFYVQEMAADDPRRVLAQRLYVVNVVPGREQALMTQMDLNEPVRWRDGHVKRDLFRGMLVQDLHARPGCDLLWNRNADAKGYTAVTGSSCRIASRSTGETLKVEQRMDLNADGLALFEQHRDASGALQFGDQVDPWFRFARRADAPW